MIIATAENAYLLLIHQQPTKAGFLKRARVKPGTYADELMINIYDGIFHYSRELKREYQKYYAVEYPRFSEFVENFGLIPSNLFVQADHYYSCCSRIIHYHPHQWFLFGEEGLRLLARLLNLKCKSL